MGQNSTTTKPKPIRVKGTGIFQGEEFCFQPCEQGVPSQLDIKVCQGGKLYRTTSEKKPLQVAHLSCPANAADPYTEYISQLERLGIKPQKEQKMPEKQRLVSEGGMEVYLNNKEGILTFQGTIDLNKSLNWQSEVMRQLQTIMRTLPAEKKFTQLIAKLKKGGLKNETRISD